MLQGLLKIITFIAGSFVIMLPINHHLLGSPYHTIAVFTFLLLWAAVVRFVIGACLDSGNKQPTKGKKDGSIHTGGTSCTNASD